MSQAPVRLLHGPAHRSKAAGGPLHRLIVAVDVEGSTKRNNAAKGDLRRCLYELLERALKAAGITARHLEQHTDRGDGVLILIRPHDDVPKTVVLSRLIPKLTALLTEHNASIARPELQLRLRAVVHAGEVHGDDNGFYGYDLDVACRLLDSTKLKRALKEQTTSPLALVISDEIYDLVVAEEIHNGMHGYLHEALFRPLCRVRVGDRQRRGWVHLPVPADLDHSATIPWPRDEVAAHVAGHRPVSGREAPRPGRG